MCEDPDIERSLSPPIRAVALRPATMADADYFYCLRTDPDTRNASLSPGPLSLEVHRAWLASRLASKDCEVFVAEAFLSQPIGVARIDQRPGDRWCSLSLVIDPIFRGQGFAVPVIQALCAVAHDRGIETVTAVVKTFNARSLRAFRAAGFRQSADARDLLVLTYSEVPR